MFNINVDSGNKGANPQVDLLANPAKMAASALDFCYKFSKIKSKAYLPVTDLGLVNMNAFSERDTTTLTAKNRRRNSFHSGQLQ